MAPHAHTLGAASLVAGAITALPHPEQNFAVIGFITPQEQRTFSASGTAGALAEDAPVALA